jgi:hypothetical protein
MAGNSSGPRAWRAFCDNYVLPRIAALGWSQPVGAEYLPESKSAPDMTWLARNQKQKELK